MRLTSALLLAAFFLTASCNGMSSLTGNDTPPPKVGRVLSASSGNGPIVISLGSRDGVKSGQAFPVTRNGKLVTQIIIHEVRDAQAAGTAYGLASNGSVRAGDMVIVPQ